MNLPVADLASLIVGDQQLRTEARQRREEFDLTSIYPEEEEKWLAKGWTLLSSGVSKLKIKRPKTHHALLEDRVWSLLYKLGYPVLSGKDFKIRFVRSDGSIGEKEIDVFAKDDETCLIVECKSREKRGKRNLQTNIHETAQLQKPIATAIRKHFGAGFKPKLVWLYATENIIWSEQDLERAQAENIRVITENELQYFDAFANYLGAAGRYQFLAEFLEGQDIPALENVRIPAVKGAFGPHTFYSFAISARHLLKISFVNHQALDHPDSRPAYQRMINKGRIKKIGQFIEHGGFFPTNLLVNFSEKCRFDLLPNSGSAEDRLKFGWLFLPRKYKSAWIIDGQHRLYGFSNLTEKYLDQTLFVVAFEKLDPKLEADLFITINHEQKSVPRNLLVTLQADLKLGSSDPREALSALASRLVRTLSHDATSPFFGRFSIPGIPPTEAQNLTVPEAVKGLITSTLIGKLISKKTIAEGFLCANTHDKTLVRARRTLNGYFRAIMDANPERWIAGRLAHICVNPGIRAHLVLLRDILRHLDKKGVLEPHGASEDETTQRVVEFIEPILVFVKTATDAQVSSKFSKKFGEGGVTEYRFNLCDLLATTHPDFETEGFKAYKARQTDSRLKKINDDVLDLQRVILDSTVKVLKAVHGTDDQPSGDKAYWEQGIHNLEIKHGAFIKQQTFPIEKRGPKEAYLDLIDCIKIWKQSNNWEHFKEIFSFPLADEKANQQKKYYLDWLEKLNDIRKTAAHKNALRGYSESDVQFIEWLKPLLYEKLEKNNLLPDDA
ncbi:MAG: DGQHR domain-containing protein [Alphaproteobacteria bacterium]|nr:DGQHR domain-containing protein [Alphaproteobacteria bacterium]